MTIARAVLLLWSGRLREAVDAAAEEIARHGAGGRRNVLRSVESHGRFLLGEARAWAPDKPDDLEPDGIGLITPERYKAEMALAVLFAGDAARARQLAEDALTLNVGSVAADEAVTEAIAAGIGGMLAVGAGQASRGHAGFGRMAAAVRRGTAEASFTGPELFHASALLLLGDLLGASAAVERDEAATDYATTVRLPVRHAIRAAVLFERGDWDSALAEVDASMAMSAELGVTILSNYSTGVKALVEAQRGDFDAAAATLSAASAGVGMEWSTWARAVVAEGRGDLAGAAMVERLVVDGFTAVGLPLMAAQIAPRAARLTVATGGDVEGLRRLITSMTADTPAPAVDARRAWALGWLDDDTDAIIAAADALFAARYVGDAAMAWRDAAQRSGGPADARASPCPPNWESSSHQARHGQGGRTAALGRRSAGRRSAAPRHGSSPCSRTGWTTRESQPGCSSPAAPSRATSATSTPSSVSVAAPGWWRKWSAGSTRRRTSRRCRRRRVERVAVAVEARHLRGHVLRHRWRFVVDQAGLGGHEGTVCRPRRGVNP